MKLAQFAISNFSRIFSVAAYLKLVLFLSLSTPVQAGADTVFKCQDSNGRVHYQNTKCVQTDELSKWNIRAVPASDVKPEIYYVAAKMGAGNVYHINGEINGKGADIMIDTGAAFLSIPAAMAASFDLEKGREQRLMSANGTVHGYRTVVKTLKIGNILMREVDAVVSPNTSGILMGQSALRLLKVEQSKGELRLSVQ
jgi:aspartyl protease family protein